jgi:hypothetical protein
VKEKSKQRGREIVNENEASSRGGRRSFTMQQLEGKKKIRVRGEKTHKGNRQTKSFSITVLVRLPVVEKKRSGDGSKRRTHEAWVEIF